MSFAGGIRKGGGFLNDVVIKVTGHQFTTNSPGSQVPSEWVNFVLKYVPPDGTVEQTHSMFVGSKADFVISADGQQLTAPDGGNVVFDGKTPFGRFTVTLLEKGFPEAELPDLENGAPLNMSCIHGYRLNVQQEKDVKGTAKRGQRKDPKTGRLYDRTNTVVGAVLGRTGGAAPVAAASDATGAALTAVVDVLSAAGGSLAKSQLNMKLMQKLGPASPVFQYLSNEKNLAGLPGISIDQSTPARTVSLTPVHA